MRTRLTSLILATIAVAGCATAPRVQGDGPEAPPALRVWIGYPVGSGQVYPIFTNREAYVAMFEIIPGRGATMVYPFYRGDTPASSAHYADLTRQPGRMFYHTDPFTHASYQPRYYYAVASSAPLNLARLQTSLGATRQVLGPMYGSYSPYDVIDRLTEIIVPMQADEEWATDLFVDWPTPSMPRFASSQYGLALQLLKRRHVRCANGRLIVAPSSYPYYGCPGDPKPAGVATAEPTPPVKQVSREAVRPPRRGRDREGIELSSPNVDERRRAEPGAQPPRIGRAARSPEGIRYSEDRSTRVRDAGSSGGVSPTSPPSSTEAGADRGRSVERAEPRSKPAAEPKSESGKERKQEPKALE